MRFAALVVVGDKKGRVAAPNKAAFFILGFCHLPNPFSKMFTAAFQSMGYGLHHSMSVQLKNP